MWKMSGGHGSVYTLSRNVCIQYSVIQGCVYSERPATNPLLKEIKAISVRLTSSGKAVCNTYVCLFTFNTAKLSRHHADLLWKLKEDYEWIIAVLVMAPKYSNSSNVEDGFWAPARRPHPHSHTSFPSPQCYLHLWHLGRFSCCLLHMWTDAENKILRRRKRGMRGVHVQLHAWAGPRRDENLPWFWTMWLDAGMAHLSTHSTGITKKGGFRINVSPGELKQTHTRTHTHKHVSCSTAVNGVQMHLPVTPILNLSHSTKKVKLHFLFLFVNTHSSYLPRPT